MGVRDGLEMRVAARTTELVSTNDHLRKSNRALRALTDCHQALIHNQDERKLMHDICHIIVDAGGYCFAWTGFVDDHNANSVIPIAHEGFEEGYLDALKGPGRENRDAQGVPGNASMIGNVVGSTTTYFPSPIMTADAPRLSVVGMVRRFHCH